MRSSYKVLLVDESEDDAFFFSRALKHTKLRLVWRARNGHDAIDYLAGNRQFADRDKYPYPDLVVLDLKMPGPDGFDVLEWLAGQRHRPKVCVYSSSDEPQDINKARALRADWFVSKEFKPAHLTNLAHFLERTCERMEHRSVRR